MSLLYFAPHQIWPLTTGGRLRDYQLALQLAAREPVTFIEMCSPGERRQPLPGDAGLAGVVTLDKDGVYTASKVLRGLTGPIPLTILNCWSPQSAKNLAEALRSRSFDTVQVEGVHLVQYLPIIERAPGQPAIVVDWHNVESELMWRYARTTRNWAKKIAARRMAALIERAEDRLLGANATHTVTSERERQQLLMRCPSAKIHVIPNGVDSRHFSAQEIEQAYRRSAHESTKPTILFVGSMDYHANIDAVTWFSANVWPTIARNHLELQFTIVGRNPAREIRALASDRIHVTGTVDDVRPYYRSAVAAIVPLRSGSGTRLKILEAMAAGVPVISTRLGAEGIDAVDDVHWLLADSAPELVAAARRVVSSAEMRARLSQSAGELVCRVYDWNVIGRKLCALHEELVESRAASLCKVS